MPQKIFVFSIFFLFSSLFFSSFSLSTVYLHTDIVALSRDSELACFGIVKELKSAEIEEKKVTQITFECEEPAKGKKGVYCGRSRYRTWCRRTKDE